MGKVLRGSNRANSFLCQSPKSSRGGKCRGNSCCADGSKDWDCFYFWQEVIVTAKLCCNIFVHRSSQMFTFSAQDWKHLDRSHKVVWWVTGYYPHHTTGPMDTTLVASKPVCAYSQTFGEPKSILYCFLLLCLFAFFTLFASSVSQANRAGFVNFACFKMIIQASACFYSDSPLNPFQQLFNNFNEGIWEFPPLGQTGFFRFGFARDKTPLRLVFELTYIQKEASRDSGGEIVEFE